MRSRINLGLFLIHLGNLIRSLAIMVMRPDDLIEFSRRTYATTEIVKACVHEDLVDSGLDSSETSLLERVPFKKGRLLLLGVGGGREAIPLVRTGFEVTGVDFVPEMVEKARENAARHGVRIEGLVQEISQLDVPSGSYNIVWLSQAMYSSVPTRRRRIEMLKRIGKAIRPEGYFICQFHWDNKRGPSTIVEFAGKVFALLTLGNLSYEKGDALRALAEFTHSFSSEDELRSEFQEGGFEVEYMQIPQKGIMGGGVLKRT